MNHEVSGRRRYVNRHSFASSSRNRECVVFMLQDAQAATAGRCEGEVLIVVIPRGSCVCLPRRTLGRLRCCANLTIPAMFACAKDWAVFDGQKRAAPTREPTWRAARDREQLSKIAIFFRTSAYLPTPTSSSRLAHVQFCYILRAVSYSHIRHVQPNFSVPRAACAPPIPRMDAATAAQQNASHVISLSLHRKA